MIYRELRLSGVFHLTIEPASDERGYFASTFDAAEFDAHALNPAIAQTAVSFNKLRGTLRGLHYSEGPFREAKVVRCLRGAIFDVAVDLRHQSATYCGWVCAELTADNHRMMYIPDGVAHGFITLSDETVIGYQISEPYAPSAARGVRWNDPIFGITWPIEPQVVSQRDRDYSDFVP